VLRAKTDKSELTYAPEERVASAASKDYPQQNAIDELVISHVDPVIKKILLQRLRQYFSGSSRNLPWAEAEDVYQTVIMKLLGNPRASNLALLHDNLDELRKYSAAIAHNVCNDFFRAKYPERNRLKDKLRDLLKRHPDFASWRDQDRTLCGFANWGGRRQSNKAEELIHEIDENWNNAVFKGLNMAALSASQLSKVIADLFHWCDGPIDIDNLVCIVAKLQGIKDHPIESLNYDSLAVQRIANPPGRHYEYIELRDLLLGLWAVLPDLPYNHRLVFIYMSQDQAGESLLHRMLREQVIRVSQIYAILKLTREELVEIWDLLPMDTQTAAMKLGVTTRMIAKWRHRALKKMAADLGIWEK
jgi:DNA-directed RNA polymerase specialized sigma24 family protein